MTKKKSAGSLISELKRKTRRSFGSEKPKFRKPKNINRKNPYEIVKSYGLLVCIILN